MNTIFQVAHDAGMRTAWADKHAAYELISGHSGRAIDDLFTPEINSSTTDPSLPAGPGPDWTEGNRDTQFYDAIKVRAILNEIDGRDHSGRSHPGVPGIFGMNFQSVSTAEKLPTSPINGASAPAATCASDGRWVPGPVLRDALGFVDRQLGAMVNRLSRRNLLESADIVISAKHGQSPIETSSLKRIDDGNVIDALNAAWQARGHSDNLVAFAIDDDAMYIWLSHRSPQARRFASRFLLGYSQPAAAMAATDYAGNPIGFHASGLTRVLDGSRSWACRAATHGCPTWSGSCSTASSTPAAPPRSRSTAGRTRRTATCRCSSGGTAWHTVWSRPTSRRPRSRPPSCTCSGSTRATCRRCRRRVRRCCHTRSTAQPRCPGRVGTARAPTIPA